MRARPARLVALTGAAALVIGALGAAPASAEPEPLPNVNVNIVDTNGKPVKGMVTLLPADAPDLEGGIVLGQEGDSDPEPEIDMASSYSDWVAPGAYAVVAVTGWGGMLCYGVDPCSPTGLGLPGASEPAITPVLTVPETGSASFTVTSGLPAMRGTGTVGDPLTIDFPEGFNELQSLFEIMVATEAPDLDISPRVTWFRGDKRIPGVSGTSYSPTAKDAGQKVSAKVQYNPVLAVFGSMMSFLPVPETYRTAAVTVSKVGSKVSLDAPKKIKRGKQPTIYVNVERGGEAVDGVVKIKVKGKRAVQRRVQDGLAKFQLPKLKPGKYKITAKVKASPVYEAASVSKKIKVKAKKHKKHNKRR